MKRVLTALGLALLAAPQLSQANLITNGDFSAGGTGWTISGGCTNAAYIINHGSGVGIPAPSLGLNSCGEGNADPLAEQTVTGLNIGTSYDLSWDYAYDHGGGANGTTFGVFLDGSVLDLSENIGGFITRSISFTATAVSHTLRFAAELDTRTPGVSSNSDVSYYLDNVVLTAGASASVPVGGTLGLTGAGLLGLRLRHRNRSA